MKKTRIIFTAIFAALLLTIHLTLTTGWADGDETKSASTRTKTVQFRQGTLIEVAFLSVKEGKQQQLNEEYFAKVMPIATEYGMKPLVSLAVINVPNGNNKPQMVGLFEWPNIEKRRAFSKDPRFLRIKPIRDGALSYLKIGNFEIEEDVEMTFAKDRLYEVYAMWINAKNSGKLNEYFQAVGPATGEYGAKFPLSLKPLPAPDGDYHPHALGIAEWPNVDANKTFFATAIFKESVHLRNEALDQLDVIHTKVIL